MKCMTLTVLCCLAIGRYAGAIDKPPDGPRISDLGWAVVS